MMTTMRKMTLSRGRIKRLVVCLCFSLFAVLAVIIPESATYASSMDKMIPEDNNQSALYNKYDSAQYAFQTATPDRKFWQIGDKATDSITSMYDHVLSGFFYIGIQITRFFNFIAREAYEFDYMEQFIDVAEDIIQNVSGIQGGFIGTGLWGSGVLPLLSTIALVVAIWQLARLRFLDSLQTMFSFVLALVIALAFISQAGTFLKLVNSAGNELGSLMYRGIAAAGGLKTNESEGIVTITEQVWMELVMKPYGMLQFDDADAYEKHTNIVDNVLRTDPFSDERDKALKAAAATFPAVSKVRSDQQMIILLFNTIFAIFILGLLSYWAIVTIYLRLKFLIHACAMSITLLASLLPGREAGLSVVRSQFIKLIGLTMQIVMSWFFLDLSLVLGHKVHSVSASGGWFTAMLLEAVTIFVVFKYREEIGSVFSKAAGNIPMTPKVKSTVMDALQRNATRTVYDKGVAMVGGMFNRKEHEGVPSTFNPSALSKASDNLNDATTASMQLRYQREKEAAEQHASETGQSVQYTPFVQKVNDNLRSGVKNPFRGMDKEWKEEKSRLADIQKDGGDVRQAILTRGVHDGMNDQQVSATMYSNENAIRQASTHMVNRPKSAIGQIQRAGTLNKNRKLETSVSDFVMVEMFERYKVEYKRAIDTAAATGGPVQHTDFVKGMDERFKSAGLNTTQRVNETMLTRKGRISVASHFESMPEFGKKRDDLLMANEAFRKATAPQEGIPTPEAPVNTAAPVSSTSIKKKMPTLPTATSASWFTSETAATPSTPASSVAPVKSMPSTTSTVSKDISILVTSKPEVKSAVDMSKVRLPGNLHSSMNEAKAKLSNVSVLATGDRIEIDTETNVQVFSTLKQRVSHEVSTDLEGLNNELKVMQRANGRKLGQAEANTDTENVVKKNAHVAQQSRKPKKQRPTVQ